MCRIFSRYLRHSVTYLSSFCDNLLDIFITNICHYFDLLDFVYAFIRIYTKIIRFSIQLSILHLIGYVLPPIPIRKYLIGYKFSLVKSSVLKINVKKIKKIVDN